MITALQPSQVSLFWENIKQAFLQTNPPPPGADKHDYASNALANLLAQKYQCWIVYDLNENGEKLLYAMAITAIERDDFTGIDALHIISLYGFRRLNDALAKSSFKDFLKYANNTSCSVIKMQSNVSRVFELARLVGFKKIAEVHTVNLRGV